MKGIQTALFFKGLFSHLRARKESHLNMVTALKCYMLAHRTELAEKCFSLNLN